MEVVIPADANEIGAIAADAIGALIDRKPDAVLGLATGSSPLVIYDELATRRAAGLISFAQARGFTLDEYVGLAADNPATCAAYENAIREAGGVDLQILGIGTDGHIAFNEPGSSLASRTRIKTLTRQTRIDNARFFGGDAESVPTHCLTQGLATIMEARHVILVATGSRKAEAVHHLVEGPVSAMWPATILQHHPRVTALLDDAAAHRLQLAGYYRETYRYKPVSQGI